MMQLHLITSSQELPARHGESDTETMRMAIAVCCHTIRVPLSTSG
jgi:hypothetical protein